MKKTALFLICLIALLLLCGCGVKGQNNMEITNNKTVTDESGIIQNTYEVFKARH